MNEHRSPAPLAGRQLSWYALLLVITTIPLFFTGCASSRKAAGKVPKEVTSDYLMRRLVTQQVKAEWMSAKARVSYDDQYLSVKANASIQMKRDSFIWVAVKKLGFEVARAMITPDSIYVIDRLNNEYLAKDLNYVTKLYNLPADFNALQAIMLGNPLFFTTRGWQMENEGSGFHLFGRNDEMESHYRLGGEALLLRSMTFNDFRNHRDVMLSLEEYAQTTENQNFSYLRNLEVDSRETGKLSIGIRFSDVEFNVPKEIRFDVPERYTRVD